MANLKTWLLSFLDGKPYFLKKKEQEQEEENDPQPTMHTRKLKVLK